MIERNREDLTDILIRLLRDRPQTKHGTQLHHRRCLQVGDAAASEWETCGRLCYAPEIDKLTFWTTLTWTTTCNTTSLIPQVVDVCLLSIAYR
jgi:hypothetical protein